MSWKFPQKRLSSLRYVEKCFLFLKELAKGIKLKKSFGFENNPPYF